MKEPKSLAEWEALAREQPERYTVRGGLVVDREKAKANKGHGIVTSFPEANPHAITPANSHSLRALQKAYRLKSIARGRIDAARKFMEDKNLTVTIPDPDELTDEELIQANGDAERLYSYLYNLAFLKEADKIATGKGGNFRGLSEGYKSALETFSEDPKAPAGELPPHVLVGAPETLLRLAQLIERSQAEAVEQARAIDATIDYSPRSEEEREEDA